MFIKSLLVGALVAGATLVGVGQTHAGITRVGDLERHTAFFYLIDATCDSTDIEFEGVNPAEETVIQVSQGGWNPGGGWEYEEIVPWQPVNDDTTTLTVAGFPWPEDYEVITWRVLVKGSEGV